MKMSRQEGKTNKSIESSAVYSARCWECCREHRPNINYARSPYTLDQERVCVNWCDHGALNSIGHELFTSKHTKFACL